MMAKKHDETAAFLLARIKSNMNIFFQTVAELYR